MKAILLCAGLGSRLHPYTLNYSKMSIPFLNLPIVSYPLKILQDIGIQDLLVNTHHHSKQVKKTVTHFNSNIRNITFTFEPDLLGGVGTLLKNKKFLKEDHFIYLNGDSVFLCSNFIENLINIHKSKKALITFLVSIPTSKGSSILWANDSYQLQHVNEIPPTSSMIDNNTKPLLDSSGNKGYFFPGLACINPSIFDYLKEGDQHLFKDLMPRISKQCFVYVQNDLQFFEVGSFNEYLLSTKKCLDILSSTENNSYSQLLNQFFKYYSINNQIKWIQDNPTLISSPIHGLDQIQVKDFAVIGKNTSFNKKISIEQGIIAPHTKVSRNIKQELTFDDLMIF